MIRVSKSPLKFFQAASLGLRLKEHLGRGQVCTSPEYPRYAQKMTLTHRRINVVNPMRKFY